MADISPPILAPAPRTDPIVIEGRDPVPVTLLTGFLGSGKTTLLNRILTGQHGLRVGVLVNDFGAINIDAELVDGIEENTISLTNGCVCCEIRDDLVNSLEQLLTRKDAIDYVILEASGVADPEGIVMTFLDQRYEKLLRLDSITCIIDAEAIFADGDNEALNMLKLRQIGFADRGQGFRLIGLMILTALPMIVAYWVLGGILSLAFLGDLTMPTVTGGAPPEAVMQDSVAENAAPFIVFQLIMVAVGYLLTALMVSAISIAFRSCTGWVPAVGGGAVMHSTRED